jgi:hypothetical protein
LHFRVAFDFNCVSFQRVPERLQPAGALLQFVGAAMLTAGDLMLLVSDVLLRFGELEALRRFLMSLPADLSIRAFSDCIFDTC